MEKNKALNEVLSKLPQNSKITYFHASTPITDVPYTLTVKGFTEFYLNETRLPDLTVEEQLVLINSNNSDPIFTPEKTVAGIFKAREIQKRSTDSTDAISKCHDALLTENRALLVLQDTAYKKATEHRVHANKLEYYLNNEKLIAKYNKTQSSKFAFLVNLKNKLLELITKKPYTQPPVSQKELSEGRKAWEEFRKQKNAPDSMSNEELLRSYRYTSKVMQTPEMAAIAEEYATTNLALQILDGSALQKAKTSISKNSFQYLKKFKALNKTPESR